jgi:histidine triad (HIT) family protein
VLLIQCDLLEAQTGPFDVIVSNPPYVPSGDIPTLQPEVRDFDPAATRLVDGGSLVIEFGFGQAHAVRAIITAEPRLALVAIREDLAGIPRIAVARCQSGSFGRSPESRVRSALPCLFCRVINGELPSRKVYEDGSMIALHGIDPQGPVRVLVVPRKHVAALVGAMKRRAAAIAKDLGIDARGSRTVFNCNREAGQSAYHIHLHLLGGRPVHWPPG